MDFLYRFSEELQITLLQLSYEDLSLFFHVNFWLKEEKDEAKIKSTLEKFFPDRKLVFNEESNESKKQNAESLPEDTHQASKVSEAPASFFEPNQQSEIPPENPKLDEVFSETAIQPLFTFIESFKSESEAVYAFDQIVQQLEKVVPIQPESQFSLDLSYLRQPEFDAAEILLEHLKIFQLSKGIFTCFAEEPQRLYEFFELAQSVKNDFAIKQQRNQSQEKKMVPEPVIQNKGNSERAELTRLAQERRNKQVPSSNKQNNSTMSGAQSVRDQIAAYRAKMRQKELDNNRFSKKNIMTFEKLEQKREDSFKYANEQGASNKSNLQKGNIIRLDDISKMQDAENIIAFGKKCLEHTNTFRKQNGLQPLSWSDELCFVGKKHSADMGEGKVPFGHQGFNDRVRQVGFRQRGMYENVAFCTAGYSDIPKVIVDGWINSPGHRKNLLSNSNVCGIAVYKQSIVPFIKFLFQMTQLFETKDQVIRDVLESLQNK